MVGNGPWLDYGQPWLDYGPEPWLDHAPEPWLDHAPEPRLNHLYWNAESQATWWCSIQVRVLAA